MINIIFAFFIIVGSIICFINGIDVTSLIFDGSKKALDISLELLPIMALWLGIAKIANDSRLLDKLALLMHPILKHIFNEIPANHESLGYISSNIVCGMFGLGNAATPFGLKAMKSLQELNKNKKVASNSMITFMVLNTSGFSIIPTTVIALRKLNGSVNPAYIIKMTIISSFLSLLSGLIIDRLFRKMFR